MTDPPAPKAVAHAVDAIAAAQRAKGDAPVPPISDTTPPSPTTQRAGVLWSKVRDHVVSDDNFAETPRAVQEDDDDEKNLKPPNVVYPPDGCVPVLHPDGDVRFYWDLIQMVSLNGAGDLAEEGAYLIVTGAVQLLSPAAPSKRKKIGGTSGGTSARAKHVMAEAGLEKELSGGDVFGESSALGSTRRFDEAVARKTSELLTISGPDLRCALDLAPCTLGLPSEAFNT